MKSRMLVAAALLTLALGACSSDPAKDAGSPASGAPTGGGTATATATGAATATASQGGGPSAGPQTDPSSKTNTQGNVTQTDTLVEFTRTGGMAGANDRLVVRPDGSYSIITKSGTKTGALNPDELAALKAALASAGFDKMPTNNDSGAVADAYTYTITYAGKQITAKDGAIPPALQPVISALGGFMSK